MRLFNKFKNKNYKNREQQSDNMKKYDLTNMDEAYDFLMEKLNHGFEIKAEIHGRTVNLTEWNIQIEPYIQKLDNRSAVIYFKVSSPEWENDMVECCASMGENAEQAVGMAVGSFMFAFMDGIGCMKNSRQRGCRPRSLKSEYNGREHRWKAYLSNVVGMGNFKEERDDTATMYWELLKDDIIKRLGNQKVCAVKIYAAIGGGSITGECRIDDIVSEELSAKVADFIKNWEAEGFLASHKQFIFIEQEKETFIPHKYHKAANNDSFINKVKICMEMFHNVKTDEDYQTLVDRMNEVIGDKTLAIECFSFLPEILAQTAFEEMLYPEYSKLNIGERYSGEVYHQQLSEYFPLREVALRLIGGGAFGEESNNIYSDFVGSSSIYNVVCKLKEEDRKLEGLQFVALNYSVDEDFELR